MLTLIIVLLAGCIDLKTDYGIFEDQLDIGDCKIEGDLTYDIVRDDYVIEGSGENIWFGSDAFHYGCFRAEGDIIVRSRIEFIGDGKHPHRKTGWMFRNELDSSSVHVSATIHGDGLTGIQYRLADGGEMSEVKSAAVGPVFVQFSRQGDLIELITASDRGIIDTVRFQTENLAQDYYTGIFICSHDNGLEESAIFSNVQIGIPGEDELEGFTQYVSKNAKPTGMGMNGKDNLIAWCIVPFDANDRTPEERAAMLKELNISKYAYDYRDRHIPEFEKEISIMEQEGIDISAVWLWIQDQEDQLLDPSSEAVVQTVEASELNTEFWISFPGDFFAGLSDEQKFDKAVNTIAALNERVEKSGCTIALYNHGDWFGDPLNQVRIIREIGSGNIGIVYNFHHAHQDIDRFPELFPKMQPYLTAVNLNGMKKEGPKIITLGEGEIELEMLRVMQKNGYQGPLGIIGHTEGEDIKQVLQRNLEGLDRLMDSLQ